ncbi:hypothetical protein BG011_009166 [Mortierella polycephala]|uniref:Uncharacterized protein n=1 Tax=Mortierella polycephala TaxID=41804 RepID=A0A9P6QI32_9FUNG|nr:hypothetical protein BG011_009166 [Mortierella polycephala]
MSAIEEKVAIYNGTVCNGFIDYKVWLQDGATVDMMEQALIGQGIDQIQDLPDPCSTLFHYDREVQSLGKVPKLWRITHIPQNREFRVNQFRRDR